MTELPGGPGQVSRTGYTTSYEVAPTGGRHGESMQRTADHPLGRQLLETLGVPRSIKGSCRWTGAVPFRLRMFNISTKTENAIAAYM